MIAKGLIYKGYSAQILKAKPYFYFLAPSEKFKKWFGYIDSFFIFTFYLFINSYFFNNKKTLYIISDQGLGIYAFFLPKKNLVMHVHDFIAYKSSVGEIEDNKISYTGKLYQKIIKSGFSKCDNFISISKNTQKDLHRFLKRKPIISEVIYNGLNYPYRKINSNFPNKITKDKYLIHVGNNNWYKNRIGVIEIYINYFLSVKNPLHLIMVGPKPSLEIHKLLERHKFLLPYIFFLENVSNYQLCSLYSKAKLLIFPSFEEGFGWPIIEAMACECLVLTTKKAPMTEIGSNKIFYLPRRGRGDVNRWASHCAKKIELLINLKVSKKKSIINAALKYVHKFNSKNTIDQYEKVYLKIIS
jgi:glycosyltransferase involved in cell wall biosynthesis